MKPRLLDLFCGAGGAAMGYHRAGWEVIGVDIVPQPNYPFRFVQMDAIGALSSLGFSAKRDRRFVRYDAIHASPPCQRYSRLAKLRPDYEWPDLVAQTRSLLIDVGLPYVIENVPGAPLRRPLILCGSMFDLVTVVPEATRANNYLNRKPKQLRRHRLFETSFPIAAPRGCNHSLETVGVYGHQRGQRTRGYGGYQGLAHEREEAMGIDWMTQDELTQAIPPAYTEYIGRRLMECLEGL